MRIARHVDVELTKSEGNVQSPSDPIIEGGWMEWLAIVSSTGFIRAIELYMLSEKRGSIYVEHVLLRSTISPIAPFMVNLSASSSGCRIVLD